VAEEIRESRVKLYELNNAKDKLIPMLNDFSRKVVNEDFFFSLLDDSEFVFNEFATPV